MNPRAIIRAALVALLLCVAWPARAEEPQYAAEAAQARDRAKKSYNEGKFEDAANDFLLSAQIDPGSARSKGASYRDLARCFFFMENYDRAVFWYDTYLKHFPKADDREAIQKERDGADERRARAGKPVALSSIYDRSLLELVETLRERAEQGAPAYTQDGGGTARLYFQAIQQGYAMPELAGLSKKLRAKLLSEVGARWKAPTDSPLPKLGSDAEPLDATRQRLAQLRSLAPSSEELDQINAWQRLVDAWDDLENERYDKAAGGLLDAWGGLGKLHYLPYAAALCFMRSGRPEEALSALHKGEDKVPATVVGYHDLLRAEVLLAQGRVEPAAELLWGVATAPEPKAGKPKAEDAAPKDAPQEGDTKPKEGDTSKGDTKPKEGDTKTKDPKAKGNTKPKGGDKAKNGDKPKNGGKKR